MPRRVCSGRHSIAVCKRVIGSRALRRMGRQARSIRRGSETMKLGVHIGYWGLGLTADEQLKLVREAESLGYDSVWTAEAYGSDAATILGWLAQATETIKLGSAIFQMPARSPAMTAMTAATLDQLSGGRMLLGIGSRGPPGGRGRPGARLPQPLR